MLDFLFKLAVVLILFIILFSITNNLTPAETISRIIEAAKELWVFIRSFFGMNNPTDPYL